MCDDDERRMHVGPGASAAQACRREGMQPVLGLTIEGPILLSPDACKYFYRGSRRSSDFSSDIRRRGDSCAQNPGGESR